MLDKKEAMARLDAIEAEAKKLREIIEALEKVEPWRPKKPTLCWRWDGKERPEDCRSTIIKSFNGRYYYDQRNIAWEHAQPLTRAEALAMVDEPSRYPWDEAPEWANWAATDWDGDSYWFASKPDIVNLGGWHGGGRYESIIKWRDPCPDWRESLEPRP